MQQYTDLEYHNNPQQYGYYQYITIEDLINNFIVGINDDDYHVNTPRERIILQFLRGIRELYYDVARDIKAVELELNSSLAIPLPQDYVNLVRMSWVDDNGKLYPIAIDNRMNIARAYLQDHQYNLLFDADGNILEGSGVRPNIENQEINQLEFYAPNTDMSEIFFHGRYNIDKNLGLIHFSSDLAYRNIVLEYISDGLYYGDNDTDISSVKIHKFCEAAANNYVYHELIKNRRNVPLYEKKRARKEYYNSERIARLQMNSLKYADMIQAFKKDSRFIKN